MSRLPHADEYSLIHTQRVHEHLLQCIADAGGALSFAAYMQEALYAPGLGYYTAGNTKFGEAGDFVTAPELSPLFGFALARQLAPVIRETGGALLEFGAGSGALAAQLLERLLALDALPNEYLIIEASPELAARQAAFLEEHFGEPPVSVRWLAELPRDFVGVIVANEVLDAIPFERFAIGSDGVEQCVVTADGDRLAMTTAPASDIVSRELDTIEADLGYALDVGYTSEVFPAARAWTSDVVRCLARGLALFIDYGVERSAYYAPDRHDGFLRCHFRHHAHNDPLLYPGIQDITSWLDFTAIAGAAVDAGGRIAGYEAQAHFLLAAGLETELQTQAGAGTVEQMATAAALRTLTMPGEMGEHLKFLACVKGDVQLPEAFTYMDRTHVL